MALSDQRVSALLLQIKISKQDAERELRNIRNQIEDIGKAGKSVSAASAPIDDLRSSIRGLDDQMEQSISLWERYQDVAEGAARSVVDTTEKAGRGGNFGGLQRVGRLAANIPGLGGVAQGLNIADDVNDAISSLPQLGAAIGELGPVALVAAPAIIGVALALNEVNKSVEAGKSQLSAALRAQNAYYEAVRIGSTQSVSQQLKDLRSQQPFLAQQIAETQNALDSAFQQAVAAFGDAGARALDAAGQLPTTQLREQLKTLQAEFDANAQTSQRLETALKDGSLAGNDMIAAEQRLAQIRDEAASVQLRTLLTATTQSTEGIQQRLGAINLERQAINQFIQSGQLSADMTNDLNARLRDLNVEEQVLAGQVAPLVAAREREQQAMQDQADKLKITAQLYDQTTAALQKAGEDVAKAQASLSKLETDLNTKLAQLWSDRVSKELEAAATRDEALAVAEADARDARAEADAEARKEEIKAKEEHGKNLLKIEREFNRSAEQAIQDRNVVALDAAEQQRDDALSDENESYKDRQKEISARLKETNQEIDKRLVEQRNQAIKRYNEQLQAAADAYNKQRQLEGQRYQQQRAELQAQIANLEAQELAYRQRIASITQQSANQILGIEQQLAVQRVQIAASALSGLAGGKPTVGAGGGQGPILPPKSFDFGPPAFIRQHMIAKLGPGDFVIPPGNRGFGGVNVNISGVGRSRRQIANDARRAVYEALAEVAQ